MAKGTEFIGAGSRFGSVSVVGTGEHPVPTRATEYLSLFVPASTGKDGYALDTKLPTVPYHVDERGVSVEGNLVALSRIPDVYEMVFCGSNPMFVGRSEEQDKQSAIGTRDRHGVLPYAGFVRIGLVGPDGKKRELPSAATFTVLRIPADYWTPERIKDLPGVIQPQVARLAQAVQSDGGWFLVDADPTVKYSPSLHVEARQGKDKRRMFGREPQELLEDAVLTFCRSATDASFVDPADDKQWAYDNGRGGTRFDPPQRQLRLMLDRQYPDGRLVRDLKMGEIGLDFVTATHAPHQVVIAPITGDLVGPQAVTTRATSKDQENRERVDGLRINPFNIRGDTYRVVFGSEMNDILGYAHATEGEAPLADAVMIPGLPSVAGVFTVVKRGGISVRYDPLPYQEQQGMATHLKSKPGAPIVVMRSKAETAKAPLEDRAHLYSAVKDGRRNPNLELRFRQSEVPTLAPTGEGTIRA